MISVCCLPCCSVTVMGGQQTIGLGMAGMRLGAGFEMRREMLSPRATTHWAEMATVLAR